MFFQDVPWKTIGFSLRYERGSYKEFFMEHPDLHDLLTNPGLSILLLCEAHGMTREKLAERSGLSTSQISKIINGNPDSKTSSIKGIAYAFGILRRPHQAK